MKNRICIVACSHLVERNENMPQLKKLKDQFDSFQIDAMLITSDINRRYVTGFTGTAGAVIITKDKQILITDFRYVEQAKTQAPHFEIVQHTKPLYEEICTIVERLGIKKLGFEQDHVVYRTFRQLEQLLTKTELVPVSALVEMLRMQKTEEELQLIKQAAAIADETFAYIITFIQEGRTEREVANEIEMYMRKLGATSSSFDIIVASGQRSALPHGVASEKVIQKGELVTLDFGALYKGYCSDITRTIAVGEPSETLSEIYHVVLHAQQKGMEMIKAGMTGKEADAITRDYIAEKGYGAYFGHSTGHGIGLEIHEGPALSIKSNTVLKPGMVVTVEPGIYIPNVGGVRIEDDIVITADGNEPLTHSDKQLIIV